MLRLWLLGSFRLEREDAPVHLRTRKMELLLAYLVLHPGEQSREKIAALFWPDVPDAHARNSLRVALAQLRQDLGSDLLLTDRTSLQINPDYPLWVDAFEFQARVKDFHSGSYARPPDLELYGDDLMNDFYDDWIVAEREYLRALYLDALLRLTQQRRSHGEYTQAIELAQRVLRREPSNEAAHQHLMFCYAALGNQEAALKQYEQAARLLQTELDVEPAPETRALHEWIKQSAPRRRALTGSATNLPIPLTSFVGREKEIREINELISTARLLTLTGAGGSGKTRLAIQVATELIVSFIDGVWWVELAPLMDESLVPHAVAHALGLQPQPDQPSLDSLRNFLGAKKLLLALDNCEHLIMACAALAHQLLSTCPNLKLLATSREALGIAGEVSYRVPTLTVPERRALTVSQLAHFEGVRLFIERARSIKSNFALTAENARAVAEISARLDGIPLALELAAARVNIVSVQEIATRLDDRFNLLTQGSRGALPRQQTLRATLDWSYDLLTPQEQNLFRRLSVFSGGFSFPAVRALSAEDKLESDALNLLARLVDKSLVVADTSHEDSRYDILETIREYASVKLRAAHEVEPIRNRHLDCFIEFANQAKLKLRGPEQARVLDQLRQEQPNCRAALNWALESSAIEKGLRLADALTQFWFQSDLSEGMSWLDKLLAAASPNIDASLRAWALADWGQFAEEAGDSAAARVRLEESLALLRELIATEQSGINEAALRDHQARLSNALFYLAMALRATREYAAIRALGDEALSLARANGDEWEIADALQGYGHIVYSFGESRVVQAVYTESLARFRKLGDTQNIASVLLNLGAVAHLEGNTLAAAEYLTEALVLFRKIGSSLGITEAISDLAYASALLGNYHQAHQLAREGFQLSLRVGSKQAAVLNLITFGILALGEKDFGRGTRLFAAADTLGGAMGGYLKFINRPTYQLNLQAARDVLSESTFAEEWAEGSAMSLDEALQYALST